VVSNLFYEDCIGTDKFNADTDGDGLSDGEEVLKYGSNPKSSDSDGLNDSYEVRVINTNPVMNWREWLDEEAFKSGLCGAMLAPVKHLSLPLRGNTTSDTAWNVLKWVDEHIEYNDTKALIPETELQCPVETVIERGLFYSWPAFARNAHCILLLQKLVANESEIVIVSTFARADIKY
jgi:hypothetical protein